MGKIEVRAIGITEQDLNDACDKAWKTIVDQRPPEIVEEHLELFRLAHKAGFMDGCNALAEINKQAVKAILDGGL